MKEKLKIPPPVSGFISVAANILEFFKNINHFASHFYTK